LIHVNLENILETLVAEFFILAGLIHMALPV